MQDFQKFLNTTQEETVDKVQSMSINDCGDNRDAENQAEDLENRRKEAVEFKEKGNTLVKIKEFEPAIEMYSRAIELFDQDPVFYSNRSQAYLKLEKYSECIEDATRAIELDPDSSKSFYRRMLAYEKLGDDRKALKNCRKWLDLCPTDKEAEKSFDKIHNRISEAEKKKDMKKIRWSKFVSRATSTSFVNRPAHLRSKKPLKTIPIGIYKAASPIPEAIIDRIFDNNTGETNPQPETDSKLFKPNFLNISAKAQKMKKDEAVEKMEVDEKVEFPPPSEPRLPSIEEMEKSQSPLIVVPQSGPHFVSLWKELDEIQQFLFLKNIVNANMPVGRILGAQLDSTLLSEIILVLDKYFLYYNLPAIQVLLDLRNNSEIEMLIMFLEREDKQSELKYLNKTFKIYLIFLLIFRDHQHDEPFEGFRTFV